MAYSPIEQARLVYNQKLVDFATRHAMTAAQAGLAWLLANDDIIVIPKTGHRERLKENLGAFDHVLTPAQLAGLDRLFPPPQGPGTLEIL
jgi:diketogulonate reductase-like aldo/keto reductase